MAARPESHRARGLERRAALIDAAIEVVADTGIAGVTHRAVAARAGFPPSTTSYFFPSIDDLLVEALSERMTRQVDELRSVTAAISEPADAAELADAVALAITNTPAAEQVAQFDLYITAARRDDVRPHAEAMIDAFEELAEAAMRAVGAPEPEAGARAIVALADGLTLHQVALDRPREQAFADMRQALRTLFELYAGQAATTARLSLVKE